MSRVQDYYQAVTSIDIGEVARELLRDRIQSASDHLLRCDCPHHASQSNASLHIMLDKQGWCCHGCGVGGDVLQLVEFIQTGQITKGVSGTMPESHQAARDYLAKKVGLPPLSGNGSSDEGIAEAEERRRDELQVQETLTTIAAFYREKLKDSPEVQEWLRDNYAISDETIDRLQIGYAAPGGREEVEILHREPYGCRLRNLAATGAFRRVHTGGLRPFFNHRIVIPYWNRGHVVYLIGRKTPWTPRETWEESKYKKLPIRSENWPFVSPAIQNDRLYNEDCLIARPEYVILTEGVTDCIALMERGFPAISPATVKLRKNDWPRILPKLRTAKTVYLCQDNEYSEVGLQGALDIAAELQKADIEARLVELPLGAEEEQARSEIKAWRGNHPGGNVPPELLAKAKIDVNDYFLSGHTKQEFEKLLDEAKTPLELSIDELAIIGSEEERVPLLREILRPVAGLSPLEQDRYIRIIQKKGGEPKLSIGTLKGELRSIQKERGKAARKGASPATTAAAGSCQAVIQEVKREAQANDRAPDSAQMAEAAFKWFGANGAQFFRSPDGAPFLFFQNQIYWMETADRGRRRLYLSMMYDQTGIVHTTARGRVFYEVMANLATKHGKLQDRFSWLHTDVVQQTVYFCLNNEEHEIAKITPDGIEILPNGGNEDGVILESSNKMQPIKFMPDADLEEADRVLTELILKNLSCPMGESQLILSWLSCFLLLDFTGTKPMTRFEGPAASGKTTASKLISTLLYGEPQQKKSTDAANYTDGAKNPLIVLDNIEVKQMTDELSSFFLTCITGIAKEKRKSGTDTETVIERTNCLLNTTGIEPLGGGQSEILSRSFIIRFDRSEQESDCFLEVNLIASIREQRDLILSALMKKTSLVLAMIRDGDQKKCMTLLQRDLGDHAKRRCNDFLSLMYMIELATLSVQDRASSLENLQPQFCEWVQTTNEVSSETARESNPTITALGVLFKAHRQAIEADEKLRYRPDGKTNVAYFLERYQLDFASKDRIDNAKAREIFIALTRVAKDFGIAFPMRSVQQFVQRFTNDLETIREAGYEVEIEMGEHNFKRYSISQLPDEVPF